MGQDESFYVSIHMYFRAVLLCKTTGELQGFCFFYLFLYQPTKVDCILTDLVAIFCDFIAFGNLVTSSFLTCVCRIHSNIFCLPFFISKKAKRESVILWPCPLRKSNRGHFKPLEPLFTLETLRTTGRLCMLRVQHPIH